MRELSERVASLEANYIALDRRASQHEDNDNERFDRHMSFSVGMKNDILAAVSGVNTKVDLLDKRIDVLWDDKNERQGASKASKYIANSISGVIGATAALLVEYFRKG